MRWDRQRMWMTTLSFLHFSQNVYSVCTIQNVFAALSSAQLLTDVFW